MSPDEEIRALIAKHRSRTTIRDRKSSDTPIRSETLTGWLLTVLRDRLTSSLCAAFFLWPKAPPLWPAAVSGYSFPTGAPAARWPT